MNSEVPRFHGKAMPLSLQVDARSVLNETALLLIPMGDSSNHKLKGVAPFWGFGHPFDLYNHEPLKKLFSRVIVYDYLKRMMEIPLREMNCELLALARSERPKYVIWPSVNYEFLESTFDALRREGISVIGFFFDDEFRFEDYSKYWSVHLDYCVTSEVDMVPRYQAMGSRGIYAFVCHCMPLDRDWNIINEKYEVSFVGARKYDREHYLNAIRQRNIPLHVVGPGWDEYVSFQGMLDIFQTSKINLNFSKTEQNKLGWKGRLLQVINAGGFLLTEYRPGLEQFFEIDREVVCFSNGEEMLEKIQYYLAHDAERRAIARAGWKRGTSEYTPYHMMRRIFTEIEADQQSRQTPGVPKPRSLQTPRHVRRAEAEYYLGWGLAFLKEDRRALWRDAFSLACAYEPLKWKGWSYHLVASVPWCIPRKTLPVMRRLFEGGRGELTGLVRMALFAALKRCIGQRNYSSLKAWRNGRRSESKRITA